MSKIFGIKNFSIALGVAIIGIFIFQFASDLSIKKIFAQQEIAGAQLLSEYFLPVQALGPVDAGKITLSGNDCLYVGTESSVCAGKDVNPATGISPVLNAVAGALKTTEGLRLSNPIPNTSPSAGTMAYSLTIATPDAYQLRLTAKDAIDSFSSLTRNQYDAIKSLIPSSYPAANSSETDRELAFRQLRFRITLLDSQKNPIPTASPMIVSLKDATELQLGAVDLGTLQPGGYTVLIDFVNDLSVDLNPASAPTLGLDAACSADISCKNFLVCSSLTDGGAKSCQLPNADGNGDGILDKVPVLSEVAVSRTERVNDVIGVRVYANPDHLSALDWYASKGLVGTPVPTEIDGYRGILDGRTAYINAANVISDTTRKDLGVFYTNIYVIAYNVNASPATINIFNQLINNWKFNRNLISGLNDQEAGRIQGQLRRDTKRLEDINVIRASLENYHSRNGKYPDLAAGTFDPGHVLSTWPSWQSVLAQQLGAGLPVDPINEMAIESHPSGSSYADAPRQFDCTDPLEKLSCQSVCTRDTNQNPKTGCLSSQQCVGADYCSVIPPGYEPQTGWNQTDRKLFFRDNPTGLYAEGSYNTNGKQTGADRFNDDAFTYQYTALDGGNRYILNYRLEFQGKAINGQFTLSSCLPGSCYISIGDFTACLASGAGVSAVVPAANKDAYRNQYCFAGSVVNSCGNGLVQIEAGEECEPNQPGLNTNYCDTNFGPQTYYNEANINPGCTTDCRLVTNAQPGNLPTRYNAQNPALSCGGFCGDLITQHEFKEQCDQGATGSGTVAIPLPKSGGSGGISPDSQYLCNSSCQSLGGWCGDSQVQTANGEQCDTASYVPPSAEQSVNEIKNGSFEQAFNDWITVGSSGTPKTVCSVINGVNTCNIGEQSALKNGLVADWSFDSVTGTTTPDVSGTAPANDATISGATVVDGISGKALQFNGTASINAGDNPSLRLDTYPASIYGTHPYTISAFFKPTIDVSNMTQYPILLIKRPWLVGGYGAHFSGSDAVTHIPGSGHVNLQYCATGACAQLSSLTSFKANTWYHYVGTYDGQFQRIYINGKLESTGPAHSEVMGSSAGTTLSVGSGFQGVIDQVLLYNRGVSAAEVTNLFNSKNNISVVADQTNVPSEVSFENRNAENIKTGSQSLIFKPSASTAGIGQRVFYAAGSTFNLSAWIKRIVVPNETSVPDIKVRLYNYDFVTNGIIPIGTGSCDTATPTTAPYIEANLTAGNQVTDQYKLFSTGEIRIPGACGSNNLNNITLAEIYFNGTLTGSQVFYLDSVAISSDYHLTYGCGQKGNQSCQLIGGFCGDGIVQSDNGEECDGGADCTKTCKLPSCGDGIKFKQQINGKLVDEVCDYSDPNDWRSAFCAPGCNSIKLGGSCLAGSTECSAADGLACAKRSVNASAVMHCTASNDKTLIGKTCTANNQCGAGGNCSAEICTLLPGQKGCSSNNQCLDGFYCDLNSSECLPRTDLYLQYHMANGGFPITDVLTGGSFFCPKIISYQSAGKTFISKDACTGLEFRSLDLPLNTLVSHSQAIDQCQTGGAGFSLPTAKQLFSLVSPRLYNDRVDGSTSYTQNDSLKFCSLHGDVSTTGGDDFCSEADPVENYVYWTDTPYVAGGLSSNIDNSTCAAYDIKNSPPGHCDYRQYYAVNFKTGSLEIIQRDSLLRNRCTGQSSCGNGTIERDEECEFNTDGTENRATLSAANIQCSAKGFAGGNVHCDPSSCKLRYDNCLAITKPTVGAATGKSCDDVCGALKGNFNLSALNGKSVGTDVIETVPDLGEPDLYKVASNGKDCLNNAVTTTTAPTASTGLCPSSDTLLNNQPAPATLCTCNIPKPQIIPANIVITLLDGIMSEQAITYLSTRYEK